MVSTSLRKQAFTLVELLVVIAIIGVLVALLLPAVQAARESARRGQCMNQLKQVALAMHNYESTHKILPTGARCNEALSGRAGEGLHNCHNWFTSLLPFVEQSAAHDRMDFKRRTRESPNAEVILGWEIPSLKCPSDPHAGLSTHERFSSGSFPETTYIAGRLTDSSMGASYLPCGGPVAPCDNRNGAACSNLTLPDKSNEQPGARAGAQDTGAPGMFAGGWIAYKFKHCTDGLSNTYLVGEVLPTLSLHHMLFHSHYIVGSTHYPPNYHQVVGKINSAPYAPSNDAGGGFKSEHPGGVNMAMADGSVDFVDDTIDYVIWFRTGDKADGNIGATISGSAPTR